MAATARSGPACTAICASATSASGEPGWLVMAIVSAPAPRATSSDWTRSGDPPDWLIPSISTPPRSGRAPYAVMVEGETSPAGSCRTISARYLP